MNAMTALEKLREKRILVLARTPEQRAVLVYESAMFRAYVEDDMIVLNENVVADDNKFPCYPGIFDCDQEKRMYYFSYLKKLDEIRIYPRYKVVELIERGDMDILIIERSDGLKFKVEAGVTGIVVYNVALNPGITIGDLIGLVTAILVNENPEVFKIESEKDQLRISNAIAQTVGFLAYEAELVDLELK